MNHKQQTDGKLHDMTSDEVANIEEWRQRAAADVQTNTEKDNARASAIAKLTALGLTENEIAALVP